MGNRLRAWVLVWKEMGNRLRAWVLVWKVWRAMKTSKRQQATLGHPAGRGVGEAKLVDEVEAFLARVARGET